MASATFDELRKQIRRTGTELQDAAPEALDAISDWLKDKVPNVGAGFEWDMPGRRISALKGYNPAKYKTSAQANVALKYHLADRWKHSYRSKRHEIAEWVIVDWGGIRGNAVETIERHLDTAISPPNRSYPSGIASLSKVLAVVDPDLFAIYDARVAAALNAVQLHAEVKKGVAFRYVPGRNAVIQGRRDKLGASISDGFIHKHPYDSLLRRGWVQVAIRENYVTYLAVMHACKKNLPSFKLAELEMALFQHAEELCKSLLPKAWQAKLKVKKPKLPCGIKSGL